QIVFAIALAHGPSLCLQHEHLPPLIQQFVYGLPLHLIPLFLNGMGGHFPPVSLARMMEVIPSIYLRKTPVKSRLMLMMPRAIFGQNTFAIRCCYRMYIRAEIRSGVLR